MSYFLRNVASAVSTLSVSGADAGVRLSCNTSVASNNYTEVAIATEVNSASFGVDPAGNAFLHSAGAPLVLSGPGRVANVALTAGGTAIAGGLTADALTVDGTLTAARMNLASIAVPAATVGVLTAGEADVDTGVFRGLSAANCVVDAFVANAFAIGNGGSFSASNVFATGQFLATPGNVMSGGGVVCNGPVIAGNGVQLSSQLRIVSGYNDNRLFGGGNTNAILGAWQAVGFGDISANVSAPTIRTIVCTRDGSICNRSFVASVGGSLSTNGNVLTSYQGNGAYFAYEIGTGRTVLVNRRGGAAGGWAFVSQDGNGALEGANVTIDRAGNLLASVVGVGNSAPSYRLSVEGNVYATGGLITPAATVDASGNLITTGNITTTGTVVCGGPLASNGLRLQPGFADNALLNGNTNGLVCSWQGIGFADVHGVYASAPAVRSTINVRDGSFATQGFVCATGLNNLPANGNLVSTYQGNAAYFSYDPPTGRTVLVNRRGGATGGWSFVSQGGTGAVEGTDAMFLDRTGNANVANTLSFSAKANVAASLANGQVTMALAGNTSLVVYARGLDGVVRSATLALA